MELNQTQFFILYVSTMKKNGENRLIQIFMESDLASFLDREEYQELLKNIDSYENVWGKYADISNLLTYAYKNKILSPSRESRTAMSDIRLSKKKAEEILECYPEELTLQAQKLYEEMVELRDKKLIAFRIKKPVKRQKGKRTKK